MDGSGILKLPYMKQALKLFYKADLKGWHERNGGNLTYRLTREEVDASAPYFNDERFFYLDTEVKSLAGEYFLATNSGSFIGNINDDPFHTLSIVKINADGRSCTVLFGDGIHKPTSELSSHLMAHSGKAATGQRIIYHSHPESITALTFILPLTPESFSNVLWRSISECALVFPEGVGVLPWMVPGSRDIAEASLGMFEKYNILIWAHHGIFSAGYDFDDAFSLVDVVEKAAKIYLLYNNGGNGNNGGMVLSTITKQNIIDECAAFGVKINRELLK
ncbi:MAG: rhamnulose-1-phosphate aldolase [Eubacteriales bacterium]|nr:rhamnulose-1-phosphate aldolase [Eubacteriales bacterium]